MRADFTMYCCSFAEAISRMIPVYLIQILSTLYQESHYLTMLCNPQVMTTKLDMIPFEVSSDISDFNNIFADEMTLSKCLTRFHVSHWLTDPQSIWCQWSWSMFAMVRAWCLITPCHYLSQYQMVIRPWETILDGIFVQKSGISFHEIHVKMSSANNQPCCSGLSVSKYSETCL